MSKMFDWPAWAAMLKSARQGKAKVLQPWHWLSAMAARAATASAQRSGWTARYGANVPRLWRRT